MHLEDKGESGQLSVSSEPDSSPEHPTVAFVCCCSCCCCFCWVLRPKSGNAHEDELCFLLLEGKGEGGQLSSEPETSTELPTSENCSHRSKRRSPFVALVTASEAQIGFRTGLRPILPMSRSPCSAHKHTEQARKSGKEPSNKGRQDLCA